MRRRLISIVVLFGLLALASSTLRAVPDKGASPGDFRVPPHDRKAAGGSVSAQPRSFGAAWVVDGASATLQLYMLDAASSTYELPKGHEIDVYQITIYNGSHSTLSSVPRGTYSLAKTLDDIYHMFHVREFGMTHYSYDPPIALRTGDTVYFQPSIDSSGGFSQLSLHGRVPPGAMIATR